ncbi:MAG: TetR/AcrR family transcriptional regulator [Corynebacterium sp.]|uniref:TetR/AcrR family transcriptional regulator n=1 Tax=Corynebacterium TaxID=1716 RepID=UPI00264A1030|nr:TetR/AcrR family transcriptional regulator [Corynebacterium sp.]MDN5721665.1 TetR/AcrR family transcriptional regulator [Corynebacterium sp.]MDN6282138.1 TetR/AcrR family transcriptional regulator [Corynebacterium sp.]MDN6305986.1 TetR/AcrR family transcriptional regulator [Corynebacterium sp.]MDN6351798.1 TetR/AcrR family transcriptional regulator [Corynebacterium sp.]MDN6366534.1 TetR/AcrR family transcriptional regulator [Corynebacterium sp.]
MTANTPLTNPTRDRIAAGLQRGFAERGFAGRSVDELREWSGVSLRTLYKYFPSREAMVIGALEYRGASYMEWISDAPGPEHCVDHVLHILVRLHDWLTGVANIGCFFGNAMSEYPDSTEIEEITLRHKEQIVDVISTRLAEITSDTGACTDADLDRLADTLFLLHEGATYAARYQGVDTAIDAAMRGARAALAAAGIGGQR